MATIDRINNIPWSLIKLFSGISANTINDISGIFTPSAPPPPPSGSPILFTDLTHNCSPNFTISTTIPYNATLPATTKVGDLVFVFWESDMIFGTDNINPDASWTKHFSWYGSTSDNQGILLSKIVNSTDVSNGYVSFYATTSLSSRDIQSWSWIGDNVDAINPVSDVGVWTQSAGTSKTLAGITPTESGKAVGFWGFDGGDGEPTTITAGWTKIDEQECDGTSAGTFGGFASIPSTASTATGDLVITALMSDGWGGVIANLTQAKIYTANLEHLYRIDAYSGSGNFIDAQGNSDIVINGATYVNTGTKHFSFDGINDYGAGVNNYVYNAGEGFSFGVWARYDDISGVQLLAGTLDSNLGGFHIFSNNGGLFWRLEDGLGNFQNVSSGVNAVINKWYYFGYSCSSTGVINGWIGDDTGLNQVLTNHATSISPTTLQIPIVYSANGYFMKGDLGDFHIYRQAIPGQAIQQNWSYYKTYYGY